MKCRTDSKKHCQACEHCDYCDKANICNGDCHLCDICNCENNPKYKNEKTGVVKNIDAPAELCKGATFEAPIEETDDYNDCEDDNEDKLLCYNCGAVIEGDDYCNVNVQRDTEIFCSDCYEDECFRCTDCGESFLNRDAGIEYRGSSICSSCSDSYYYCNGCEQYIYYEDFNSDLDCCYECAHERETGVESYHASNYWDFIGESKRIWRGRWRGIGIELEIDRDNADKDAERQTVSDIRDIYDNLKFEYDGSLENGFEIITHPHTVEEFYKIDWAAILQTCKDNGYVSHGATHCGLHVHFSRIMFGLTEKRQANNISKLINFFERFWNEIIKVSRRTEQQARDYAGKYGITDINEVKKIVKNKDAGRYFAINNTNKDTVEIRIMRGTLNLKSFLACIDFCITVVNNSKYITWNDINETATRRTK